MPDRAVSVFVSIVVALAILSGCDEQTERVVSLKANHQTRCPKHTWAVKSEFIHVAYAKDWQKVKDAADLSFAEDQGLIHPYVMVTCSDGSLSFTNGADK
jgi:hypothetical protein